MKGEATLASLLFFFLFFSFISTQYPSPQCEQAIHGVGTRTYPNAENMILATGHGNYGFYYPLDTGFDPGHWDGCHQLRDDIAQYCTLRVEESDISIAQTVGICLPSVCTEEDIAALPKLLLTQAYQLPVVFQTQKSMTVDCSTATYDYPFMFYGFIVVVSILAILCVVGTTLELLIAYNIGPLFLLQNKEVSIMNNIQDDEDTSSLLLSETSNSTRLPKKSQSLYSLCGTALNKKSKNMGIQLLLSFSIPYNVNRLLSTPPPGNMEPLNGIRVIAMIFVVLGHTFYFIWDTMPVNNFIYLKDVMQTMRFQIVVAGFFAVDTFFWLSGFLVSYLFIKELREHGIRRITFPMFYFHRVFRLTPTLLMGLFFYWFITPYWADGPYWRYYQEFIFKSCNNNWFYTVLYINNFVPFINSNGLCMGWTWYLADDMQFYIFSPILLLIYWKNKWAGWIITTILIILCIGMNLAMSIAKDIYIFSGMKLISAPFDFVPSASGHSAFGEYIYLPPWTRVSPYLVGFLSAFILLENKDKFYVPPILRTAIYASGSLVIVILSFIPYTDANYGWSEPMNVFYISFSRTMWAFALSGLMLLCIIGYGGFFRELMSYSFWVPMARLSYGAYIFHLANIGMIYNGNLNTFTYQFATILYYFLGHLLIAFGYSTLNFLLLEKPLMNIESVLLFGKKRH